MQNSTVLVTGGSGLIGTHLIKSLISEGSIVISLARSYPLQTLGIVPEYPGACFQIEGDIRNQALLEEIFANHQPTHLVHLAAQPIVGSALENAEPTFDINIRGTWLLLEAARKYGKLRSIVIASSDKAYGQQNTLPYRENFELKAKYPYDVSKQATEQLAMSYYHTHGLPISITRCGNTFGAYDLNFSRIVPGTILSCLKNEDIIIRSSGRLQRCYVYAEDVADAYLRLLTAPQERVAGQAFNVGNPTATSVIDIVKNIQQTIPESQSRIVIQNQVFGEIEHQSLDSSKIASILGWQPRSPLYQALEKTVAWYRSYRCMQSQPPRKP
ncbi:NAD-dependent epimerase/dehydratase family protein [Alcanivorax quisquiliarum]|uniref:GDP-mannose 4,6-dehydratase n=1 Tax=Alcanivorax quisquiliarum TaxID=2933565 RepID=A0ABT0E3J5_9GAMM|nr:NAD-dependent epimerase/dehydratase family protein [Alcanivorax quisquiliarum]MCK0536381.1 GDP-mannose 4,6-dehydratase [Alcanivorax quisquiliarum]